MIDCLKNWFSPSLLHADTYFKIAFSSLWSRGKARRWVSPFNTQCLQNSVKSGAEYLNTRLPVHVEYSLKLKKNPLLNVTNKTRLFGTYFLENTFLKYQRIALYCHLSTYDHTILSEKRTIFVSIFCID